MAGRDTRVAPRVLRPIHRSLRVVPFGGIDISRRKPFLIIGVASRRRPRARYVAGPASPAKRGGKILLRGAGSDARAQRSRLSPYALSGLYDLRILRKKPVQARPRPRPSKHQSLLKPSGKDGRASSSRSRKCDGRSACGGLAAPASARFSGSVPSTPPQFRRSRRLAAFGPLLRRNIRRIVYERKRTPSSQRIQDPAEVRLAPKAEQRRGSSRRPSRCFRAAANPASNKEPARRENIGPPPPPHPA
jgi:hypothetical protein